MTLGIRYAARSDVGMLREGNEDSAYAGSRLIAVADGMGGHVGGEIASAAAINTLRKLDTEVPAGELLGALEHAVQEANSRLHSIVEGDPSLQGMGTTLTAMLWSGGRIALVHIGDSRAYLLRNGELFQITHDHTLVQSLVDEGRITLEDAATHPQRSLLLRALDGRGEVEPDLTLREAQAGDRYLLCSDGLSGVVSAETIHQVLVSQQDPELAIRQLIDLANRGGGPDNVTCVVADVIDLNLQPPPAGRSIVAGAAAVSAPPPSGPPPRGGDSPAARAAEFRDTLPQPALGPDGLPKRQGGLETMSPPAAPPQGPPSRPVQERRGRRWTWLIVAVGVVVALAAVGGYVGYNQLTSGFFISTGKGSAADLVVIYKGDPTNDVLGVNLSGKASQQPAKQIRISDLPQDQANQVRATYQAGSSNAQALAKAAVLSAALCKYTLKPAASGADATIAIFRGVGRQDCPAFSPVTGKTAIHLNQLPAADRTALSADGGVAAADRADATSKLMQFAEHAQQCQQQPGKNGCPTASQVKAAASK